MLNLMWKNIFLKITPVYEKFTAFLYRVIKKPFFQKIFLIFVLISSIMLSIACFVFGVKIYPHSWFFMPHVLGFFSIPAFFILFSIYFLKNLDLFDYICKRVFTLFVKPFFLLIIIILFSLGFYFIYSRLFFPKFFYFLVVLPILPIYLVKIIFEMHASPTTVPSLGWAIFVSFILIIPLMIYCFNFIGKKMLLNNLENIPLKILNYNVEKKGLKLRKEIIIIWFISAIISFFTLFNTYAGTDTAVYWIYVKDYLETGNLDLLFNPSAKSEPKSDYSFRLNFSFIPFIFMLIFFTIICGCDISLC